jgi:hypothetical protein
MDITALAVDGAPCDGPQVRVHGGDLEVVVSSTTRHGNEVVPGRPQRFLWCNLGSAP